MIIRATVAAGIALHDLVSFDEANNQWIKAVSHVGMIGAIIGIDDGATEAIISLNGEFQAYTSRVITPYGGRLNVEDGRVYIDNDSGSNHRFVFPYTGDLDENGNIPSGTLVNVLI